MLDIFIEKLEALGKKYEITFADIEREIAEEERELCTLLGELRGSEYDMKGVTELKSLLGG